MRHVINIDYPVERFHANRRRLETRARFRMADRAPVGYCVVPRYFAPIFGVPYRELFRDAETQYHWLLQFARYRMERIPEDLWCEPAITVAPYFDNVVNPSALGAEIGWGDHETPRAIPTVHTPDAADALPDPEPTSGLWGKALAWRSAMEDLARNTQVTIGGQEARVVVAPPSIGGEGPHMVAVDLVGEDFYWWQLEYPLACERLLDKITRAMMRAEDHFRSIAPSARGGFGIAEDSAQIMSVSMFRRFCVPYDNALFDRYGAGLVDGRGMHMCGDPTHLLQSLHDDERITSFNVFGYRVDNAAVARVLGGSTYLWGNLDPMMLLNATASEVKAEARRCLEELAPCGGLMLGDGANVCPGTPLDNLTAVTAAAEEYGAPAGLRDAPI